MHVYSTKELRAKIRSNDYGAELCLQHAMANIESLEMQIEALRKDADRYRWLRDFAPTEVDYDHTERECGLNLHIPCAWSDDPKLDGAVDAAMAATPVFGAA